MLESGSGLFLLVRLRESDARALHYVIARRRRGLDRLIGLATQLGSAVSTIGLVLGMPAAGSYCTAAGRKCAR